VSTDKCGNEYEEILKEVEREGKKVITL